MNPKTKEFREQIAKVFIESLKNKGLQWKKEWRNTTCLPENAVTGAKYKGINRFYLTHMAGTIDSDDLRFATFKQIQEAKWSLRKGAKGFKVEYWMPYDFEKKKAISWSEFKPEMLNKNSKIGLTSKYYTVFNAKDILGIPELPPREERHIETDKIIPIISKNMNVMVVNDGGDRAYYRPLTDEIHMPKPESFTNEYAYNSTLLHEMAHATGAAHRLNRDIRNIFGSPSYAFEELVAEISSCFTSLNLSAKQSPAMLENHAAYVNGWIKAIENSPEVLIKAINQAEKAANYLEYNAELIPEAEYKKTLKSSLTVDENKLDVSEILSRDNTSSRQDAQVTRHVNEQAENSQGLKEIKKDLESSGYHPTEQLVNDIRMVNQQFGKQHTVQEVKELFRNRNDLDADKQELLKEVAKDFIQQEKIETMRQVRVIQPEP